MRIIKYFLSVSLGIVSLSAGLAEADQYDQRTGFEPISLALDGQNLYSSCRGLADAHLEVLRRIEPAPGGSDRQSKESQSRYEASVRRVELEFLSREGWSLESIAGKLRHFEEHAFEAPAAQLKHIPIGELGNICRVASAELGSSGLVSLPAAIKEAAAGIRKLDQLTALALKKLDENAAGTGAVKSGSRAGQKKDTAISAEEYRQRRELWEAHLRQQDQQAEERERFHAENLRALAERPAAELPQAKVGFRKDLPPPAAAPEPKIEPEMGKAVAAWHRKYWNGMKPLKFNLSQVMVLKGPQQAFTRRESCKLLYASTVTLLEQNLLKSPDPAVGDAAQTMVQQFQLGALKCLESKDAEMETHMNSAQQELGRLAALLVPYQLMP